VGGGWRNQANGDSAAVGGGYGNYAVDSATVAGGRGNTASDYVTTVAGGLGNQSLVYGSTVAGGLNNTAQGYMAAIPGGASNVVSGSYSFAAGFTALATNNNSFVWSDGSTGTASTGTNQFVARASGGFVFFTGSGAGGAILGAGATSWSVLSDRNAKKDIAPADTQAVLNKLVQVPIEQWRYQWEGESGAPHLGPMAQDFKAAFYPGRDDKGISTLEFDGVELAAIQGLNQKLEQTRAEAKQKDAEIQELKQRLEMLEARLGTQPSK